MDYVSKQKMLWRSRRSMLELDLYFERFINRGRFNDLSDAELLNYNELLKMEDEDLILLFQGKVSLENNDIQEIIEQIKN